LPWINPVGGYGDMLMVSGVLKQVIEKNPDERYNLVRRSSYYPMFKGHPAIVHYGYPPKGARIQSVTYGSMEELGPNDRRPYQILARSFGLETPVEERLFIPNEIQDDPVLYGFIPWKGLNILIAPTSDSPRKVMPFSIWNRLVKRLVMDGPLIIQVGRVGDPPVKNAYSLRGLTTPQELVGLVRRCDLVVTSDNFIMHAAHLTGTKAVVLWGPTHHEVYGYPEQFHIQASRPCEFELYRECIGPSVNDGGRLYGTPCPYNEKHCMDSIDADDVYDAVKHVIYSE
jgi:ADP-heptose:LPS heptosyltransferase